MIKAWQILIMPEYGSKKGLNSAKHKKSIKNPYNLYKNKFSN